MVCYGGWLLELCVRMQCMSYGVFGHSGLKDILPSWREALRNFSCWRQMSGLSEPRLYVEKGSQREEDLSFVEQDG